MTDETREARQLTTDEVRDKFIRHLWAMIGYWDKEDGQTCRAKIEGAVFSTLVALDGSTMSLPGFAVIPMPHEDDEQYARENGSDWFPSVALPDDLCDIGGTLHERFFSILRQPGYKPPQTDGTNDELKATIAKQEAEIADLREKLSASEEGHKRMADLKVRAIDCKPGAFEAVFDASEFLPVLAGMMGEIFESAFPKDHTGPKNFVEFLLQHPRLGQLVLTIQRRIGKTPGEFVRRMRDAWHPVAEVLDATLADTHPSNHVPQPLRAALEKARAQIEEVSAEKSQTTC